jgi:hypothetical protein
VTASLGVPAISEGGTNDDQFGSPGGRRKRGQALPEIVLAIPGLELATEYSIPSGQDEGATGGPDAPAPTFACRANNQVRKPVSIDVLHNRESHSEV